MAGRHGACATGRIVASPLAAWTALVLLAPVVASMPLPELPSLVLDPTPSPRGLDADQDVSYSVTFDCPAPLPVVPSGCPMRVHDPAWGWLHGNPGFVADPQDPNRMAFAIIHGSREDGPTPIARGSSIPHSTFTTFNGGASWQDQYYGSPKADRGDRHLGVDIHATLDGDRNLVLSPLYAYADGGGWRYYLLTFLFGPEERRLDYGNPTGHFEPEKGAVMGAPALVYVPQIASTVLLWHERASPEAPLMLKGAVSRDGSLGEWTAFNGSVGPCRDASLPASLAGLLYVACVGTGEGDAPAGRIDVLGLDPQTGALRSRTATPLSGGRPVLAAMGEDRLAVVTVDVPSPGSARVELATGPPEGPWRGPHAIEGLNDPSRRLTVARVQAILHRAETDTIHFVFLDGTDDARGGPPNPNGAPVTLTAPMWRKAFVVAEPTGRVLFRVDLGVSDKGENSFPTDWGGDQRFFGDTRDTLADFGGTEYLAFGDYGVIVMARVIEHDQRPFAIALSSAPPAAEALPAAEAVVSTVHAGAGVVAGTVASVAIWRLAAQRQAAGAGRRRRP